ncbi:MAG: 3-oxoacyl-ACP reductase FabG [Gammaproteobacteria bacterium]|nr:3-oxoacyl-ACP reductase FabG [Gammaproteobacteria bacterium]
MQLDKQVTLVTGASRGIGRCIAEHLALQGAIVIGTATGDKGVARIEETLGDMPNPGAGRVLDVRDTPAVQRLVESIAAEFGAVQILVNNAGITLDNLLMRMKDEEWDATLDTNLSSVYRLSKACLRGMMKAKRGRIINITSVVGVTGNPGQANYAAAKAGIIGFTKSLAREVASRNITVNAVAPGLIETDMTNALPAAQRQALLEQIPLQRLGAGEDIAAVVGFLAGPSASYITGQTLHVNGGMYLP